jgi:hypothetical protein
MDQDHNIPVACSLSDVELRNREATILAQFKSSVVASEESADGYAFRLPGDSKSLALVAELISLERMCCLFFKFELTAQPNMGPLVLRITGPAGTKEFLKSLIG